MPPKAAKAKEEQDGKQGEDWVVATWRDDERHPRVAGPFSEDFARYLKQCRKNEGAGDEHVIVMRRTRP